MRKEYPLVLLHVTLLPIPQTYSSEVMEQVLPSYILENWKILREKVTDTVLERGILIPHPREDYDLMEERLLESLDLKTPRILKCGHFHLDPEEDTDVAGSDEEGFDEEDNEADFCADCGRKVRDGKYGSGNGSRRWDIKVYAANGLMRAGAWGAAWREMERVDVEITPWMDEVVKRELALRAEEERKHTALLQEGNAVHEVQAPLMDAERMREIYGDDSYIERDKEDVPLAPQPSQAFHQSQREVPLRDLLKNYVMAAAQDRKNIAIFLLSMFVLYLSMASGPALPNTSTPSPHHPLGQSVSTSVPARTDVLSMSTSFPSSLESSIVQASATEITASAPKEQTVAVASSSSTVSPTGDSMDWIEARFEFAGE